VTNAVSKRFFVTLPDAIGDALDRWAESERNKPASLAAFLLEQAIREAMDQGKIPNPNAEPLPDYKNLGQVVMHHLTKLVDSAKFPNGRLKELMGGAAPTEIEVLRIALICGLTEEYVSGLPLNGGTSAKSTPRTQ
jgi:hypothetical protein